MSLFSRLRQETTDINLHVFIKDFLSCYDRSAQLEILIDMFDEALDNETHLHEAVVTAWNYLETTELYLPHFSSLQQFKTTINFSDTLEPILNESRQRIMRMSQAIGTVLENWNIHLETDLPKDIQPPHLSKHLAEAIARLSHLVTYDQAIPMFHTAIQTRLKSLSSGKRLTPYLCKQDVDRCRHEIAPVQPEPMEEILEPSVDLNQDNTSMMDVSGTSYSLSRC